MVGPEGKLRVEPAAILDRRLRKRRNEAAAQILVRWSNLTDSEATWEDLDYIRKQFPNFLLEGKELFKEGGMSGANRANLGMTVEKEEFDLVKGETKEKGIAYGLECEEIKVKGPGLCYSTIEKA